MPRSDPAAGRAAEEAAARELSRTGWRVLARNCRTPFGEIDIVATRRGRLAFVEVKARRTRRAAGSPEEALTPAKMSRVGRAADHLARSRGLGHAPREFLGAAVDLAEDGTPLDVRFVPIEEVT